MNFPMNLDGNGPGAFRLTCSCKTSTSVLVLVAFLNTKEDKFLHSNTQSEVEIGLKGIWNTFCFNMKTSIARWHFVGIFSFLLSRINFWTNIRIGRDLRRHAAYVMVLLQWYTQTQLQKSIIHHPCDMRVRFTERSWPVLCKQIWWLYCICRVGVQALSRFLSDDDSLILCPDWDHI